MAMLCCAHMGEATPKQYTHDCAYVRTASHAYITTFAHYKTTETTKRARANRTGTAPRTTT